ncbi:MAG: hypothetical protein NTW93_06825 [Phycisphaerae bacterium]|nr:hypothetical protein [Phycisphaerae bacterium]
MVILGDIGLLLLIFISAAGVALSFVIHLCSLFNIYSPSKEVITLIYIGILVVIYPACIISYKMRSGISTTDFKNTMLGVCPRWMSVMTGFFIMYAFAGFIFFISRKYFTSSAIASNNFRGFSGHWMALYSLALILLYSCRRLKKNGINKF